MAKNKGTSLQFSFLKEGKNFNILVGILTILAALWIILYAIPGIFASLFNTILGNIILILMIILVGLKNVKFAIGLFIVYLIIFKFAHFTGVSRASVKEGYTKKRIVPVNKNKKAKT